MSSSRGAVSRADLLLALSLAQGDEARARQLAAALSFNLLPEATATTATELRGEPGKVIKEPVEPPPVVPPSQALLAADLLVPTHIKRTKPPPAEGQLSPRSHRSSGAPPSASAVIDPARTGASAMQPPPTRTLLRGAQWWPALHSSLSVPRSGGTDWLRLVNQVAHRQLPQRLPRKALRVWGGELWVIADLADRLRPYQDDLLLMLRRLISLRGLSGLKVIAVQGHPDARLDDASAPREALKPPPGTTVVLWTDLGALCADASLEAAWLRHVHELQRAGAQPVCWAPLSAAQVPRALAKALPVHVLQPGAGLKRQKGRLQFPEQRQAERKRLLTLRETLESLAACCVQLEPGLLRELRQLTPELRREPALEALYWGDTQRVSASAASRPLRPEPAAQARARLQLRPEPERAALLALLQRWHSHRARSTRALEASLWQVHADTRGQAELPADVAAQLSLCEAWMADVAALSQQPGSHDEALAVFARDLVARQSADAKWMQHSSPVVAALWAATGDEQAPVGVDAGAWLSAQQVRRDEPEAERKRTWRLIQRGESIWAWPQAEPLPRYASPIAEGLQGAAWVVDRGVTGLKLLRPPAEGGRLMGLPANGEPCKLSTESVQVTVDKPKRPGWAVDWGRDAHGLFADFALSSLPYAAAATPAATAAAAAAAATAATTIPTQRLRYLPPGEFWMGSPDDEPEREDREGPRHRVRLTEAFWLADTACTQALWQAVMGQNPSRFKDDPQNPVEQVSWDDVQDFLSRLQPLLPPGVSAVLPTEAQWEYACRSGTETPFSFGDTIMAEQVNFHGNYPYAGSQKSLYREKTLPVKSLSPNAWGLYQMHGNVWEWCSDSGQRNYRKSEVVIEDPQGPAKPGPEAHRAVRGGSWSGTAWGARSAFRAAFERGGRNADLGFRLALRSGSTGPGPAGPSELKAPEAPSGPAGPRDSVVLAPGRDGPGPAPRRDAGARPAKTGPRPAPPKAQPRKLAKKKVEPR